MNELASMTNAELSAEGFVRVKKAAEFLGVSERQVYVFMDRDGLPWASATEGGARLIPRLGLRLWAASKLHRPDVRALRLVRSRTSS